MSESNSTKYNTNLFFVSPDQSIEAYWKRWSDAEKDSIKTWMDRNSPRSDYEAAVHELAKSKITELDAKKTASLDGKLFRPLFCPICGVRLALPTDGSMPTDFVLPEHENGAGGNLCQAFVITIKFELMPCARCGAKIPKHPSGLCRGCYEKAAGVRAFP